MTVKTQRRQRRTQERTELTRQKLLSAAVSEFSSRGFDGVTSRDIEIAADVQRGLLKYHFGDKDSMWRAAADELFHLRIDEINQQKQLAQDLSDREQLALRIRAFVRFSAEHPELNRMMVQEGKRHSWRTDYIIENYISKTAAGLKDLTQANLPIDDEIFVHWYYFYIGAGAFAFSVSPEAKRLFGTDVSSKAFIDRHAELLVEFLMNHFETFAKGN
ncbi:MAG: TetR family transcriptional regulator [Pseudomonadota bacterium]